MLIESSGKRSYYVDTKKAGEWLMLLAESRVPSALSQRAVRSGSGVAMVVNSPEGKDTGSLAGSETEVKNQNMMEYAPYMVVVLILILFAFFAFRKPKTEGA